MRKVSIVDVVDLVPRWITLPNRSFLELPFLPKVRDTVCLPEWDAIASGECEVEFASCICDEWVGCCLGCDSQARVVVM